MDASRHPTAGCRFLSLPYDCWMNVIARLSATDISILSTTCKAMCAATEPFLYMRVDWDWDERESLQRLLRLLRTILARPDLASLVRHVSFLATNEQRAEQDMVWRREWFTDVVEGSIDVIKHAQLPDAHFWIVALKGGVPDAFIAVLISLLPMLNSLRLDYEFLKTGYSDRMVRQALCSSSLSSTPNKGVLSTFSRLQLVDYGGCWRTPATRHCNPLYIREWLFSGLRGPSNMDQFISWLCLSSIQRLDIRLLVVSELEKRHREQGLKLTLCKLQTLFIARSKIPEQDILFLLSQASSLKSLHLGPFFPRHNLPGLGNGILAQALESVSGTVENLSIDLRYYGCCGTCVNVRSGRLREEGVNPWAPFHGIFKKFTNLQTLEIPVYILFAAAIDFDFNAVLPETLRKLCLRNDRCEPQRGERPTDAHLLNCVHAFLDSGDWRSATPFLQNILIQLWDSELSRSIMDSEKQLRATCVTEGIDLDLFERQYCVPVGVWLPCENSH